jgi:cytochrome c-type biogenesis protein CcmH
MIRVLFMVFLLSFSAQVLALSPDERLTDPALEQRAKNLTHQVRCPVCQGEAIDESNADLARDLRRLVRARLTAGDTDRQVLSYLQNRYGDFILMQPPVRGDTAALWLVPLVIFIGGFVFLLRWMRASAKDSP